MGKPKSRVPRDELLPRKQPVQERAQRMAGDLLDGATRVLRDRGAEGFTTNRVAEATGASIGSLYQYYPNKASLLAAVHQREASSLLTELEALLADARVPARQRFVAVVERTIIAQVEAQDLQAALHKEGVDLPESPGFAALEAQAADALVAFLCTEDEHPDQRERPDPEQRRAQVEYVLWVVFALLERIAKSPPEPQLVTRLTADTGNLLADFLGLTAPRGD